MKLIWAGSNILPGTFRATILDIEAEEDFVRGDSIRTTFEIQEGMARGETINHSFYHNNSGYLTAREPLGKMVKELLGSLAEGDEVNLEDLIGKDCLIKVEMKNEKEEPEDRLYSSIVDIKALESND